MYRCRLLKKISNWQVRIDTTSTWWTVFLCRMTYRHMKGCHHSTMFSVWRAHPTQCHYSCLRVIDQGIKADEAPSLRCVQQEPVSGLHVFTFSDIIILGKRRCLDALISYSKIVPQLSANSFRDGEIFYSSHAIKIPGQMDKFHVDMLCSP